MKIGSLFAGIGGFDLAFERQGFKSLWQVEIDRSCRNLLTLKFPRAKVCDDVITFNQHDYECPTVLTFGSPCQDLSVAGQRKGMAGERSGLFFHATRIIRGLVGRGLELALWENVPGCFSSTGGRDFAAVLGELAQCGAVDIAWRVLDAQWFGLAQRRKRVFLVADFRGERAAEILALSESLCGHPAPCREAGKRIAPTIEGRAGRSGETNFATRGGLVEAIQASGCLGTRRDDYASLVANPIASHHSRQDLDNDTWVLAHGQGGAEIRSDGSPSLTCNHEAPILARALCGERDGYNDGSDQTYIPTVAKTLRSASDSPAAHGKVNGTDVVELIAFSSKDSGADASELAPTLRSMNFDKSHINGGGQVAIAFKPNQGSKSRSLGAREEQAPTLEGACGGNNKPAVQISGQSGVRRLMPLECERLQGFPDGWTSGFSDSTRYRMLGNAVAVPVVEWIAKRLKNYSA